MKKICLAIFLNCLFIVAFAQKISKVTMTQTGDIESMYLLLDENITVNLSKDGNISGFGIEVYSDRIANYSKLDTYPGRVEYYSANDNEAFRGKVKYIGRTQITYYGTYDKEDFRGKVKTIGSTNFEYYSVIDDEALKGKLRSIGSNTITWYTSFDNEAYKGKLKSIGATGITYYASFDDKAFKGKIKSIGNAAYTYYASTEKKEYNGMIKSGNQSQTINGIKFYIKF